MSDIPVCQQCGKKLYKNYGSRGILATPDHQYHSTSFYTEEERSNFERDELPENAFDIDRYSYYANSYGISYRTPQQSRDGLFIVNLAFINGMKTTATKLNALSKTWGIGKIQVDS